MTQLGLVVNPVAGIGGTAGLAGSDGEPVQEAARLRGGAPKSEDRARAALAVVAAAHPEAVIVVAGGAMGERAAREAGLATYVAPGAEHHLDVPTTGDDTRAAVSAIVAAGATLVLFAGGDGTARDVASTLPHGAAALGIPTGVKMYSPVFAVSPRAAGSMASEWLSGKVPVVEREVLDIDERELRRARVEPRIFATMPVPYRRGRTQARKSGASGDDRTAVLAAARGAVGQMQSGVRYLLGPGGTMTQVAAILGVEKTPLGVDVVLDGQRVLAAASERELLNELRSGEAKAMISIIGGQGFLLGRGNQQISAAVLRALGRDPLIVVAPEQKLIDLGGRPLLVDTGDRDVDGELAGFVRVVTAAATTSVYPVSAPEIEGESNAT